MSDAPRRPPVTWETRDQRPLNGEGPHAYEHVATVTVPVADLPAEAPANARAWHDRYLSRFLPDDPQGNVGVELLNENVQIRVVFMSDQAGPGTIESAMAEAALNEAWADLLLGPLGT